MNEQTMSIVGNLTAKPELSFTHTGVPVVTVTIAQRSDRYDRATDTYVPGEPLYVPAVVTGQQARNLVASADKGTHVMAVGRLKQRRYKTAAGDNRTVTEMQVDYIGPSWKYSIAIPGDGKVTDQPAATTTPPASPATQNPAPLSVPDPWSARPSEQ